MLLLPEIWDNVRKYQDIQSFVNLSYVSKDFYVNLIDDFPRPHEVYELAMLFRNIPVTLKVLQKHKTIELGDMNYVLGYTCFNCVRCPGASK